MTNGSSNSSWLSRETACACVYVCVGVCGEAALSTVFSWKKTMNKYGEVLFPKVINRC